MNEALRLTDSLNRVRGPMMTAAIGDALGWPVENRSGRVGGISRIKPRLEFEDWLRREGGGYAPHQVRIEAGSYSDDTQLVLAVARSRMRGEQWLQHLTEFELPIWLLYERGGGGATKRAAQAWNRGVSPWSVENKASDVQRYWRAGGNGVAMRVMPHVLAGEVNNFRKIAADIVADGVCTHGHPRALLGAVVHSYALWLALEQRDTLGFGELIERILDSEETWGSFPPVGLGLHDWTEQMEALQPNFDTEWHSTRREMRQLLEASRGALSQGSLAVDKKTLGSLGAFDKATNGAGTIAAAAAIFLASRYASRPPQGLVAAAFAKGADTDTIASMTGALLGAIQHEGGFSSLLPHLQDVDYIEKLASGLARGRTTEASPRPWRQDDRRAFLRALSEEDESANLTLPVFGRSRIQRKEALPTQSSSDILEWVLSTEEGQTLHVKRVIAKKQAKKSAPVENPSATPFWVVLQVADLETSQHFYADVFGFPVRKNGDRQRLFVSDRIVLEEATGGPAPPPQTEEVLLATRQSITLFMGAKELEDMHRKLAARDAPVSGILQREGRDAFRCADPDGNVIEVRAGARPQHP